MFFVLIRCPSCIAAIVLTNIPLYFKSIKVNVSGNIKSRIPVTLFIIVCKTINSFRIIYPIIKLNTLIVAITIIQIISQFGMLSRGINFIRQTMMKIKSEIVSNFEPNLLTAPVLRATISSTISLISAVI